MVVVGLVVAVVAGRELVLLPLLLTLPSPSSTHDIPLLLCPNPLTPLSFAFLHRFPCTSLLRPETTHQPMICLPSHHHGPVANSSLASHVSMLHKTPRVAPNLAGSLHAYM